MTTNGLQQQTIFVSTVSDPAFGAPTPVWPGVREPDAAARRVSFPLFSGIRVFDRDYVNPRIYSFNAAYEQELAPDVSGYVDFMWNEGRHLTRFLNYNRSGPVVLRSGAGHRQRLRLQRSAVGPAARRSDGDQQPRQARAIAA